MASKAQKNMVLPVYLIFNFLQKQSRLQIWLFEQTGVRIEGTLRVGLLGTLIASPQGFDEYMNLVLDNAVELNLKKGTREPLGMIMLKGENVTLISKIE